MRRFFMGTLAALIAIVGAALPAGQSRAQGLVEYALILVVVPFAPGERVELLWYPRADRGRSDSSPIPSDRVFFSYRLFNSSPLSGRSCRQSVSAAIRFGDGINGMRVAVGSNQETLEVNGETVAVLDPCFVGASRLSLEVGVPVPPETVAKLGGPGRVSSPPGQAPVVAAASVLKADGQTTAVISYWDAGFVTLDLAE